MLQKLQKRNEGFTIIEVLIVLAIAGLIMLVVFLAVPALQRNSRNTQRKADVAAVLGGLSEYINNNNGQLPTAVADFCSNVKLGYYVTANCGDVTLGTGNAAIGSPNAGRVYVNTGAKCNAGNFGGTGATARNIAVLYTVETGGGTQTVCTES